LGADDVVHGLVARCELRVALGRASYP